MDQRNVARKSPAAAAKKLAAAKPNFTSKESQGLTHTLVFFSSSLCSLTPLD